ncbi:methionine-gamma lyase [Streptomyces sp. e14]|nr:methionine-gamma lyase [Streptomyces sp. e14]
MDTPLDPASTSAYEDVRTAPCRALATEAVHAGREDLARQGLHAPPIDLSTTYPSYDSRAEAARIDAFAADGAELDGPPVYGRLGNPTVARFETALARLEGTESAVAFASGMAALSAVLLVRSALGLRHVVAVRPLYGCSDHLLTAGLLGSEVTWTDPAGIADALRPDTGLVMVETPANPTLAEVDLRAVAHACGSVPLLADNTFATPVLQRPAEQGARLVLHSATKYLGGHGDWMAGVVALREELRRATAQERFAPAGCCTRSPAICCCAGCPPCRYGCGPPPPPPPNWPPGSRPTRASPACTTRGSAARWSPSKCTATRTPSSARSA